MLSRRNLYAYAVLMIAAILVMLRLLLLPTVFEIEGLPLDIAMASALNACYFTPGLSFCSDGVVIVLAIISVTVVAGWGSAGRMIFALILMLLPLGLYLFLSPIWLVVVLLLALPPILELGVRVLVPATR